MISGWENLIYKSKVLSLTQIYHKIHCICNTNPDNILNYYILKTVNTLSEGQMKKFLTTCFILIVIIAANNIAIAAPKQINFCTLPFAPFVITDQNNQLINGFDIDLAKAAWNSQKQRN